MNPRMKVDPIACAGHGVCAELFPERIRLDDWGYPIVDDAPIPDALMDHARNAAEACPKLALKLAAVTSAARTPRPARPERRPRAPARAPR